jgi:pimeloyl-ACP methyl ester carboxylesterase
MERVDIGGLQVAYQRAGSGPPLVLLHGFVGDGRSTFSKQLDELSRDFTVVAWDAPGAGESTAPPVWFRIADYADCLAEFVRALSLQRPHLAGLSFGGALILELYRRHPDVARTLILAGAYAGWAGSLSAEAVDERVRLCLRLADLPPDEFLAAMLPSMFSPSAPTDAVAAFAASIRRFNRTGFLAMMWSSAEADLRDVLPRISVPTLVLHGDRDVRSPLEVAHALHSAIPASKLVVLPGIGHVSPVEAPDLFNHEVSRFLETASLQPS